MDRPHRDQNRGHRGRRRDRRGPYPHRPSSPPPTPLTEDGVPAAIADAPVASPVVFVSDASRARFPWLPGRVIAGSVWRGEGHVRVRVDEHGEATPWRCPAAVAR